MAERCLSLALSSVTRPPLALLVFAGQNPRGHGRPAHHGEPESFGHRQQLAFGSALHFVNAAGLRPQDCAFVGLSNFRSFDRNHAGKERTKTSFGHFEINSVF
jgi:hypothetical protein